MQFNMSFLFPISFTRKFQVPNAVCNFGIYQKNVIASIPAIKTDLYELQYLYWIPIHVLYKNLYKEWHIAGSSKCSTIPLLLLLTKLMTTVKEQLQTYSETTYARSGLDQMWMSTYSENLLFNLKSQNLSHVNGIKTYDFCNTLEDHSAQN